MAAKAPGTSDADGARPVVGGGGADPPLDEPAVADGAGGVADDAASSDDRLPTGEGDAVAGVPGADPASGAPPPPHATVRKATASDSARAAPRARPVGRGVPPARIAVRRIPRV